MMKQTTKRLLVSLAALILSVGAVCTSYAASDKRKVGKMDLVFDSNLGLTSALVWMEILILLLWMARIQTAITSVIQRL